MKLEARQSTYAYMYIPMIFAHSELYTFVWFVEGKVAELDDEEWVVQAVQSLTTIAVVSSVAFALEISLL